MAVPPAGNPGAPRGVVVLMSVYEGERFVGEQVASILRQLPADGRLLVRDDGSRDGSADAVQALGDARVSLSRGANLGFGASFLTLLSQAPPDAPMVMFADQDDVWLPGKIERAWRRLAPLARTPSLYGSAQLLTDAALRPLHATRPWPRGPSLPNALTENIITGCTAALNGPALALLQRAGVPAGVHFHDWWLYLVVSAFGTVVYDDEPSLLYRQHGGNVIGHGAGWVGRQRGMLRFLARNDWVGIWQQQVGAFLDHYGKALEPPTRDWIRRYFGPGGGATQARWRLVFTPRRWRQALVGDLALRVLLVAHKLGVWPPAGRRFTPN